MGIVPPMTSKRRMASKVESKSPLSKSGVEILVASRRESGNEIIPRKRSMVGIFILPKHCINIQTKQKRGAVFAPLQEILRRGYVEGMFTPFPAIKRAVSVEHKFSKSK